MAHILPKKIPPRFVWKFKSRTWSVAIYMLNETVFTTWISMLPTTLLIYLILKGNPNSEPWRPKTKQRYKAFCDSKNSSPMDGWMFPIRENIWLTKKSTPKIIPLPIQWFTMVYPWSGFEREKWWKMMKSGRGKIKRFLALPLGLLEISCSVSSCQKNSSSLNTPLGLSWIEDWHICCHETRGTWT